MRLEIADGKVFKTSESQGDRRRLQTEVQNLQALHASPYTPNVIDIRETDEVTTLVMDYVDGENAKTWLEFKEDWLARKLSWEEAKKRLGQYVVAEMDLLSRGAMYRDLNLEHLIFTPEKAVLIDHGATIKNEPGDELWKQDDWCGTWETMAPEEFPRIAELTSRTATYRVAVISHLALTGHLPFSRFPSRSQVYDWRKTHAPAVSPHLPRSIRKVFTAALARKPEHRHKDPASLFESLGSQYDPS